MLDKFFVLIAPHYCLGCDEKGTIMCASCQDDILADSQNSCLKCGAPILHKCHSCNLPFQKSWQVSKREGVIKNVVDAYKFKSIRAAAGPLAELFDQHLPQLPSNTVIVPIPTVPKHIRQRGFAHMEIVTRKLAKLKGCCYSELLKRKNNTVQFGQNAKTRQAQAKQAFACPTTLDPNANYLIIDDICTTGATLIEAAKVLKKSGAKNVWVAVLAHQSLK